MTGMREDLERRRHHRQPRRRTHLPPVREWTVGQNGVPWDVGVRLPILNGAGAAACLDDSSWYCCTRRAGHGGRHAAAGRFGHVYAVWEQQPAPAEVPC